MNDSVIFTDLDGTLLDHRTYTFDLALPALEMIRAKGIPLIICSSKTRREIEWHRQNLDNRHPFISENGGGIFLPAGYFDPLELPEGLTVTTDSGYSLIRLGAPYQALRRAVVELRSEGFEITGFGDMGTAEVAAVTGLAEESAAMARERDFDEPFLIDADETGIMKLLEAIRNKGFNHTQGRFFHILGDSDKGRAVAILAGLYRRKYGTITTIALGDGLNDLPMLERVDYPVLVQGPDGRHNPRIQVPGLIRADGIGPAGWNRALLELLGDAG